MGNRFEDVYRFGSEDFLTDEALNLRFKDVDDRVAKVEVLRLSENTAFDIVLDRVLSHSEGVIASLRDQLLAITELQWLTARSDTPRSLEVDGQISLSIVEQDRALFAPGPYALLSWTGGAPDDYAIVKTLGFDRGIGQWDVRVEAFTGDAGPHADWQISAVAGATLAQMALLDQSQATLAESQGILTAAQAALDAVPQLYAGVVSDTAAYAATALNAPGTLATQSTDLTISPVGTPLNGLLDQVDKSLCEGMSLTFWHDATNWMAIQLETFDPATRAWAGAVRISKGAGTHSSWKVSQTAHGGVLPERSITVAGGMLSGGGDLSADRTLTLVPAAAADVWGNNDTDPLTGAAIRRAVAKQALTFAATIAWDTNAGWFREVTLTANAIMGLPTNIFDGQTLRLSLGQGGAGSFLITAWNTFFDFGQDGFPVLSTVAGKTDFVHVDVVNVGGVLVGLSKFWKAA